jgi:transposase-like protein
MNKREYSRDFKLMVVRQVENGEKRPVQACREYDLANSVLDRWRNEYRTRGEEAFTSKNSSTSVSLEGRVAELERLCGQLTLENSILKKALQRAGLRSDTR